MRPLVDRVLSGDDDEDADATPNDRWVVDVVLVAVVLVVVDEEEEGFRRLVLVFVLLPVVIFLTCFRDGGESSTVILIPS